MSPTAGARHHGRGRAAGCSFLRALRLAAVALVHELAEVLVIANGVRARRANH
ncbi:hypothetical protein [Mycobacterium intracellulare]|uniref:hypothetical protein n=1 Tax=Mycobacterium intracellulare TaxID=1767 RepID=UPI0025916DB1|nr:hypothetical protein [Mycobacterium intracellulare]